MFEMQKEKSIVTIMHSEIEISRNNSAGADSAYQYLNFFYPKNRNVLFSAHKRLRNRIEND